MLIPEDHALVGASEDGSELKVYDDMFGNLYLYQESCGPWMVSMGIIRAQSWESALDIARDEFLSPVENEDLPEAYGFCILPDDVYSPDTSKWYVRDDNKSHYPVVARGFATKKEAADYAMEIASREEREILESYAYQSNATGSGIVRIDDNERLDHLSEARAAELKITLRTEPY